MRGEDLRVFVYHYEPGDATSNIGKCGVRMLEKKK